MSLWEKLFGVKKLPNADKAERTPTQTGQPAKPPSTTARPAPPALPASQPALRQARSVATPEQSALLLDAAKRGDLENISALLEANPDLVFSKDNKEGLTPLHWASYMGHKDAVELLLGNKADVNAEGSKGGQAPLLLAAAKGHKGVTELLLAAGASVNAADKARMTPLHAAASAGFKDVTELLLAKGANLNAKNIDGNTPLQLATRFRKNEVMEVLRQSASASGSIVREEERKSIYSEFHRYLNTHAMIDAASRGLGEKAGIEYALTKASEHIERSYSLSFEQWTAIFKEGQSKKWDKWP